VTAVRPGSTACGRLVALAAVGLLCAACASAPAADGGPGTTSATKNLPVLAAAAVPGLARTDRWLGSADLAKDASVPGIANRLAGDGYLGGRERTFQGPSRHLTFVASRLLVFRDRAGAADFLAFVRAHADAWFGSSTQVTPVVADQRAGFVFEPSACACHLANPVLVAIVLDGSRLAWLEINGPDATRALLLELMAPSMSTEAG